MRRDHDHGSWSHRRAPFDNRTMLVSLDRAIWFHCRFRADDWLLYAHESPSAQGGRGLTRGLIFKPNGTLVASVAQELMENRHGLLVDACLTQADGHAERMAALFCATSDSDMAAVGIKTVFSMRTQRIKKLKEL